MVHSVLLLIYKDIYYIQCAYIRVNDCNVRGAISRIAYRVSRNLAAFLLPLRRQPNGSLIFLKVELLLVRDETRIAISRYREGNCQRSLLGVRLVSGCRSCAILRYCDTTFRYMDTRGICSSRANNVAPLSFSPSLLFRSFTFSVHTIM